MIVSLDLPPGTVPFTTTDPSGATGRSLPSTAHDEISVVPENGNGSGVEDMIGIYAGFGFGLGGWLWILRWVCLVAGIVAVIAWLATRMAAGARTERRAAPLKRGVAYWTAATRGPSSSSSA